jgi:hypothetical protein
MGVESQQRVWNKANHGTRNYDRWNLQALEIEWKLQEKKDDHKGAGMIVVMFPITKVWFDRTYKPKQV